MTDHPIVLGPANLRALLSGLSDVVMMPVGYDRPADATEFFYWPTEGRSALTRRHGNHVADEGVWARKAGMPDPERDFNTDPVFDGYIRFLGPGPFAVGDRLWVREAFCAHWDRRGREWPPGATELPTDVVEQAFGASRSLRAPSDVLLAYWRQDYPPGTPPVMNHLSWVEAEDAPRWASRLTLTVTSMRVMQAGPVLWERKDFDHGRLSGCQHVLFCGVLVERLYPRR